MRGLLPLVLLAASGLAGCDSADVTAPSGPHALTVDFTSAFDDDRVRVELDGVRIYDARVTTADVLGLAERAEFSVPDGAHELRVRVGDRARATTEFRAGDTGFVSVSFDRRESDVELFLAQEPFCCYD